MDGWVRGVRGAVQGIAFLLCAVALVSSTLAWSAPASSHAATPVDALASGADTMCALTSTSGAECWGWNYYGQLGVGTDTGPQICGWGDEYPIGCAIAPVAVRGLGSGVSAIAGGYAHACALTTEGAVKCWGYNAAGQLGDGTASGPQRCGQVPTPCSMTPVPVSGPASGVRAIAAGWDHTCAVTDAGGVECWGDNGEGQLGDGTTAVRSIPVAVQLPSGMHATAVAGGGQHTCALTSEGGVECWGYNAWGQLGDGTDTGPQYCDEAHEFPCSTIPVAVKLPEGVTATALATGGYHTCAVTSSGGVECWGRNDEGELGDGTTIESWTPVAVKLPEGVRVTAIAAEAFHTCALTSEGGVLCWGENGTGQLGDGSNEGPETCGLGELPCSTVPVAVGGLEGEATAIAAGEEYSCAATAAGGVQCWGYSRNGALGDGYRSKLTPAQVIGLMWSLSVSVSGAGSGTVSSSPAGIACSRSAPTSCAGLFAPGSTVWLRASPASGSGFAGFTGGGCSGSGSTCEVKMSEAQSVLATFALAPTQPPGGGGTETAPPPTGPPPASPGGPGPSPSPAPGPPSSVTSTVTIETARAQVVHGRTKVWLACAGGSPGSACQGTLRLQARFSTIRRTGPRMRVIHKTITLAIARYEVPSGRSEPVTLALTRTGQALLAHGTRGRLRVRASATGPGRAQRTVVLRVAHRGIRSAS
jgi:alpha-tubulin suppressor-like RCC1 family protein